ncbi:MAG: uridine phosphorylase [Oligoflexus sp.]
MNKTVFHLGLDASQVQNVDIALVPGDPGRVPKIAKHLKGAKELAYHREFCSMRGQYEGREVLICSTGIGGPSAAICVEELAMLGVRRFLRIGTTGALQDRIEPGDVIIPTGAVRMDGASLHMAPLAYPAVADYHLVHQLVKGVADKGFPHHVGIIASSDTFYQGQSRQDSYLQGFVHQEVANRLSELKALNVLSFEMECATLFTQCASYGLSAAAILGVLLNRNRHEFPTEASAAKTEERVIHAALTCIGIL